MTHELTQEVKTALTGLEAFKSDLLTKVGKFDAFDEAKFNRIADDIGKAIEAGQKEKARADAIETEQKALKESHKLLEAELSGVKTALNRAPSGGNSEDVSKELRTKCKKAFNAFARTPQQLHFDEFLRKEYADDAEFKSLSTGSDPAGGYLVMPEFGGIIQEFVYESSPVRQLASVMTIGTDTLEYVLDNDQNTSGWVGEQSTRTNTTTPTFGKLTIYVNEMYSNPAATQKMLDDAGTDIEAWLADKVASEFARKEATAFVTGSGVMQPKGLLSYDSGTTVASQQIEQVVTGSATDFTYDGLVGLQNSLKEDYQSNAVFLIRRASNANLMKIKDGEGRPIFNMTFDKNAGMRPTIMGQPVYFAADVPAVAGNALAMIYGDIKRAYQIVDRTGIRVLRDPYSSKPNVSFYTTKRVGGGVKNFEAFKIGKIST
ncbi:MAG: phage major capsid protein [Planctomycetes bacterium]|nr:phage major capsid protein [Planctomycetota bacterium]